MKKMVVKSPNVDEKATRKAMESVAGVKGVNSVTVDRKGQKITIIGDAVPLYLLDKLRKFGYTDLRSLDNATESALGKKKEPKKEEKKYAAICAADSLPSYGSEYNKSEVVYVPRSYDYNPWPESQGYNPSPEDHKDDPSRYQHSVIDDNNPNACLIS